MKIGTLASVTNFTNDNSAVAQVNSNSTILTAALNNTVSLDGSAPNVMTGNVDFSGGGRIINLSSPSSPTEPVRFMDLKTTQYFGSFGTIAIQNANAIAITGGTLAGVAIGTPTSGVLTNCTGLPLSTGITGFATGAVTFLTTATSANLAALVSDETGTGSLVFANTPTLVTPVIGAATGTSLGVTGSVLSTGTAGIGYATGAGGAVTQLTSRTTGVTLNKISGAITLFAAAGAASAATFTVTNSTVAATDVVIVSQKSGTNLYNTIVTSVSAGAFNVTFFTTGGTTSDSPVFNFVVIKGVVS